MEVVRRGRGSLALRRHVVEPKFLLELLVGLFTDPPGLIVAASVLMVASAGRFDT